MPVGGGAKTWIADKATDFVEWIGEFNSHNFLLAVMHVVAYKSLDSYFKKSNAVVFIYKAYYNELNFILCGTQDWSI